MTLSSAAHSSFTNESDNAKENQIGQIVISRKWHGSLLHVHNRPGAHIASDHLSLTTNIRLKIASIKGKRDESQWKYAVREQYFNFIRESVNLEWFYIGCTKFRVTILKLEENQIGYKNIPRKPWNSKHIWDLTNSRLTMKNNISTRAARFWFCFHFFSTSY